MKEIFVGGLDPSLSNFGLSKGLLNLETGEFKLLDIALVESKADNANKKVIRKNSDDLNRATKLYEGVQEFFHDTSIICVEIPVGSQSARSMASYGICIGILAGLTTKTLIQVTPTEVKLAAVNNKTASKQDMINWATKEYPNVPWLTRTVKGEVSYVAKNEHIADSVAAIHAGVNTDQFKGLRSMYLSI